ncbi:helix-turn-helix domain-containing protein [Staphylococcus simulans]|uniref:helix-turn-helix domain-containing protein n=2 Tax=Staphylococcus simulans TaxID=1286 RepID=UPI000D1FC94D|nr:helix-turn-helix transcriptional regulator [Staphylococcus simulans]PTJ95623.1 transcriptional regulator [Staphylococcus simulans]
MDVYIYNKKVKKMMFLKGWNMTEMANLIGVSTSYFSQIMNKRKKPSTKLAKKIADALDVEIKDLFEFDVKEA